MLKPVLVVAAAALVAGCVSGPGSTGPTTHEHQVVDLDKAELTHVNLHMGGGELDVEGGAAKLLDANFTYNVPAWKPSIAHTASGKESDLVVSQGTETTILGRTENTWQLALNNAAPMDVTAHLGAGRARMTLGSLNLRGVELHLGAGEADMDLRGTPTTSYSVQIHGGVGQATVQVPASVAISATASGGIGDIKVKGLEMRDGRWVNPRVESGPVTITLDVHGGIGEIDIIAE